ncbi:hypothetical protein CEXT_217721 [Caerostris extrusa]|uniref:Uncharacterized protein n=1 Tax=Caerostris extrusa TaxID=172846 RepID=A0AAV4S4C1_CAEEX|nr:hypothetical protein CEXT_217721 [Caerostris extrusa]
MCFHRQALKLADKMEDGVIEPRLHHGKGWILHYAHFKTHFLEKGERNSPAAVSQDICACPVSQRNDIAAYRFTTPSPILLLTSSIIIYRCT